jgi:hypothetical protein
MDPDGPERLRLEGYLSRDEFRVFLEMGLARVAFMRKNWATARSIYDSILSTFPYSKFAAEAIYYRGVSQYSTSHDHKDLTPVAEELFDKQRGSIWAMKSEPWLED